MVHSTILTKSSEKGPFLYAYAALKIGPSGFLKTVQQTLENELVRVRRKFDFYTLMPRCIYEENEDGGPAFNCYTSYVALVRKYPKLAPYFNSFSPTISKHLKEKAQDILDLPEVQSKLTVLMGKVSSHVRNFAEDIVNKAKPLAKKVSKKIKKATKKLRNKGKHLAQKAHKKIKNATKKLRNKAKHLAKKFRKKKITQKKITQKERTQKKRT